MSNALQAYVEGIHRELDYYPAWPPNATYELGAVGLLRDGQFQQLSTLSNLGIEAKSRVGNEADNLSVTSGKSVTIQFKAKGETVKGSSVPKAKAAAVVEFNSAGAFLFQAHAPVVESIEDKTLLSERILEMFRSRKGDAVGIGTRTGAL
jgi:hypothetical protein